MTPPWQYVPGVPAAGHVTGRGWWHPGAIDGCAKCPPPPQQTYEAGMAVGEARAMEFADVRTDSLPAPRGSSADYKAGWRAGFANVRNLRACEDRLAAGDESFRGQFEYMTAALKRHAEGISRA